MARSGIDELHRYVQDAIGLAGVVDGNDVRVVEGGGAPGFSDETLPERLVVCQLRRQELQGDLTIQLSVPREINLAHAAAPNQGAYVIGTKHLRTPILVPLSR